MLSFKKSAFQRKVRKEEQRHQQSEQMMTRASGFDQQSEQMMTRASGFDRQSEQMITRMPAFDQFVSTPASSLRDSRRSSYDSLGEYVPTVQAGGGIGAPFPNPMIATAPRKPVYDLQPSVDRRQLMDNGHRQTYEAHAQFERRIVVTKSRGQRGEHMRDNVTYRQNERRAGGDLSRRRQRKLEVFSLGRYCTLGLKGKMGEFRTIGTLPGAYN